MSAGIIKHFSVLKDPRIERKKLHSLIDITVLTIFAMLSGAEGWEAIEDFGHENEDGLMPWGCQHAITKQIKEQGGDYCISLKGNQSSLHDSVKDFFRASEENNFNGVKYSIHQETDKEHGRLETRKYYITEHLETLPNVEKWEGLKSIGMVPRKICTGKEEEIERRYFINSIAANAAQFAGAVRGHWEIENRLHWRLDVTLREDASRIRKGNAPVIVGTIRHMCLGLFDADATPGSLAKKRRKAAWSDSYRARLLFGKDF